MKLQVVTEIKLNSISNRNEAAHSSTIYGSKRKPGKNQYYLQVNRNRNKETNFMRSMEKLRNYSTKNLS